MRESSVPFSRWGTLRLRKVKSTPRFPQLGSRRAEIRTGSASTMHPLRAVAGGRLLSWWAVRSSSVTWKHGTSLSAEHKKIIFHLCPSGSFSSSLSLYPCFPPLHAPSLSPSPFPPSLFFSLPRGCPLSFPLAFISFVFPFPLGPQLHAPLVLQAAAQLCRGVTCSLLLHPQVHCPQGHRPALGRTPQK